MEFSRFTTLSFDCYGTLIDWEAGILAELRPWLSGHGRAVADESLLEHFGALESDLEAAHPAWPYPEVLKEVHLRLAQRYGLPVDAAAATAFGRSVGRWPAFADSAAALQYLKRHFRLVVLSNVDRASFAESNARLGVAFDHVFTAQDIGTYKPNTANFRYLLGRLAAEGVSADQVLHVAQSLFHDIAPAKALGLAAIWVNRRRGKAGAGATPVPAQAPVPDAEVGSLGELADWHRRWQAGPPS